MKIYLELTFISAPMKMGTECMAYVVVTNFFCAIFDKEAFCGLWVGSSTMSAVTFSDSSNGDVTMFFVVYFFQANSGINTKFGGSGL